MLHDIQPADADQDVTRAHERLREALRASEAVLDQVVESAGPARGPMEHLISRRGKLIRPRLVLLSSAIVAADATFSPSLAAAAELIHSASLLHDDVIDAGDKRRDLPTARVVYSNAASVLAGDHCLTDAMDLIRVVDPHDALAEALRCVRNLVDGELIQLETRGRLVLDEDTYRRVCELKTASLFVWGARAGARFGGGTPAQIEQFGEFARDLGVAFQIRDDLLDFIGGERYGKDLHEDLREGRSTLPLIFAAQENAAIADEMNDLDALSVRRVVKMINETEAIARVTEEVTQRVTRALQALQSFDDSPYRTLLNQQIAALR